MFILFNQMFCSRTNVLSKARGCSDPPGPSRIAPSRRLVREFPRPFAFQVSKIFPLEFVNVIVTLFQTLLYQKITSSYSSKQVNHANFSRKSGNDQVITNSLHDQEG